MPLDILINTNNENGIIYWCVPKCTRSWLFFLSSLHHVDLKHLNTLNNKHFRHILESHHCTFYTNHSLLIVAVNQHCKKLSLNLTPAKQDFIDAQRQLAARRPLASKRQLAAQLQVAPLQHNAQRQLTAQSQSTFLFFHSLSDFSPDVSTIYHNFFPQVHIKFKNNLIFKIFILRNYTFISLIYLMWMQCV